MTNTFALRIAALMGLVAVGLGAFGAHGLSTVLAENKTTEIWEKAVFYHFIHTVMLMLLGTRTPLSTGPWWSFLAGIIIFSGSLYILALTNIRWLGAITPIGGLSLLLGWAWLLFNPPNRDAKTER